MEGECYSERLPDFPKCFSSLNFVGWLVSPVIQTLFRVAASEEDKVGFLPLFFLFLFLSFFLTLSSSLSPFFLYLSIFLSLSLSLFLDLIRLSPLKKGLQTLSSAFFLLKNPFKYAKLSL